jgi:hypothetical protein
MNINKLPEYFAIKWSDNPLWKDYIRWLNKSYNADFNGFAYISFYGYDGVKVGYTYNLLFFKNPVTVLTLEQWDNIVNKTDEFVLPERWVVKVTEENKTVLDGWKQKINPYSEPAGLFNQYLNYKGYNNFLKPEYTEITFEQFKKYVLKQDNMKEIIGYNLKNDKYKEAARKLLVTHTVLGRDLRYQYDITHPDNIYALKQAGVLDLWFEPVYKEEKTLPKLNGYEGKLEKTMQLEGDLIVYGCAKFSTYWIEELYKAFEKIELFSKNNTRKLKSIKLDSGVEITIEQIKQIYEYIKSKD